MARRRTTTRKRRKRAQPKRDPFLSELDAYEPSRPTVRVRWGRIAGVAGVIGALWLLARR